MIPHLKGRETSLKALGWRHNDAEWIALVCLHGGLFIRSQYAAWRNASPMAAVRFVRRLVSARVAVEDAVPAISSKARLVRICSRPLYQAIGATGLHHRKTASKHLLLRRLLSLDYVLEHTALPWLPTEAEKVLYCRQLGIDPELLPGRLYGGAAGRIRRLFSARMPIAGGPDEATFVYTDTEERTLKGLSTWGADHHQLWRELRRRGIRVRVVAVARNRWCFDRSHPLLKQWARAASNKKRLQETARLTSALSEFNSAVLETYGGYNSALRRYGELLRDAHRYDGKDPEPEGNRIDEYACWDARRLGDTQADMEMIARLGRYRRQ